MKILAIETSCDDTGLALIETDNNGRIKILANLVSSQIKTHRPWGGVVPNLAKREHQKALPLLFSKLQVPSSKLQDSDLIAVTNGPGLAPCLWTGINFAQDLAKKLNRPLVGINHLKGHIFLALLEPRISNFQFLISKKPLRPKPQTLNPLKYPLLSLIVSGGHTQLVYSKKLGHYQIIGETRDDAAGEAFDKVAKLLGLSYPGGPEISRLAEKGNPTRFDLPRPMINSPDFDFSFSGLKTAVLYLIKGLYPKGNPLRLTVKNKADLAASFEQAVVDVLIAKTILAARKLNPKTLVLGGGVAANKKLRRELKSAVRKNLSRVTCLLSPISLTGDNALMIALAAYAEREILKPLKNPADLIAQPNLRLA
ncbi:MAG: tRNA (adenosine(37)-N6)-threonylcarbamoyltransferase complex transferase subunit TsaD [Parcubacteria group bacterium]|nr:tRNA (adenosine(37)-N6)-threonylcarbamoyltransferase complex transferase subunit TsaD [Parcubacteria group bacterium]